MGVYKKEKLDIANTWKPNKSEGIQITKWIKELKNNTH